MIKFVGSLVLCLVLCLVLAGCAPTPKNAEEMILIPKSALNQILEGYTRLAGEHQELLKLREWQDKMFF